MSLKDTGVFKLAAGGVNPRLVPQKRVVGGDEIPAIGFGTFGSDSVPAEVVAQAVREAISLGYRHLDCASVYDNEAAIGAVLKEILASGVVKREELWITSKLWNDRHGEGDVLVACAQSLKDLKIDYLDLYLVHWPFPNFHPKGCPPGFRNPHATPYIHENYMKTWRQMERLVKRGLVRHIGTSNMTLSKIKLVLRDAEIKPAVNEMELHPHFQQPELFQYVVDNGILPIGYCPLGSPHRPERDRTEEDTVDLEDPVIIRIAEKHRVHPAEVSLKWAVQRGQIPIPFSTKRTHILANLQAVTSDPLTLKEMAEISRIDRNCRLIKGQVFLWEGSKDWRDIWE